MEKIHLYFLYFFANFLRTFSIEHPCHDLRFQPRVCLPGPEKLLTRRRIQVSTNKTCGNPPGRYCRSANPSGCFTCNNTEQHSAIKMTDQDFEKEHWKKYIPTWWQSITWWDALQRNLLTNNTLQVYLSVSMNKSYDLIGEINIVFYSSKPKALVIEKSVDYGDTWEPLRYYSTDCLNMYKHVKLLKDKLHLNDVYCEQLDNDGVAIQGEEITFQFDYTADTYWESSVQNLLKATDVRIVLDHPWTDGNEKSNEETSLNKYYYDIADMQINARCHCNGHAPHCFGPSILQQVCDCKHFTDGIDCEMCLPLYNNKPWMPANSRTTPNPCEACECNQHSSSCTYNSSLGHGVCDKCLHGTDGYFCQTCDSYHFRNHTLPINDENVCVACDCFFRGTLSNQSCSNEPSNLGECLCKDNVMGKRCDKCRNDHFGLNIFQECKACNCSLYGTKNTSNSCKENNGQCDCKPNTAGRTCSLCKFGYHSFPASFIDDCKSCSCDSGGSFAALCNNQTGQCPCRQNIEGLRCNSVPSNYFVPFIDSVKIEAESGLPDQIVITNTNITFTGVGYKQLKPNETIKFRFVPPQSHWYYFTLRYIKNLSSTNENISLIVSHNITNAINRTELRLHGDHTNMQLNVPFYMEQNATYTFTVYNSNPISINVDSFVFIPDIKSFVVYNISSNKTELESCWNHYKSPSMHLEEGFCKQMAFSLSAEFFNKSFACNCDVIGSINATCDPIGGYCYCKKGVTGRTCDQCALGYFNFTKHGCQACECNSVGSTSLICSREDGQCSCKSNVTERTCSKCLTHHFGLNTGDGCTPCLCNGIGSQLLQCNESGQCLCKKTIEGEKCSTCIENYFNLTTKGCSACTCNVAGSTTLQCHRNTGACSCKKNVMGKSCNECKPGFFNLHQSNKYGCKECFCFNKTSTCHSSTVITKKDDSKDITEVTASKLLKIDFTRPDKTISIRTNLDGNLLYLLYEALYLSVYFEQEDKSIPTDNSVSLVIIGNNGMVMTIKLQNIITNENTTLTFLIEEDTVIEKYSTWQIQSILASVEQVTFQIVGTNADYIILYGSLLAGDDSELNKRNEVCECSANYTGPSCERCAEGYTRELSNSSQFSSCVKCKCNNRSTSCHPETGECSNCRYGTFGMFCEKCAPNVIGQDCTRCLIGYYGYNMTEFDGCRACDCISSNTITNNATVCDIINGQCPCKPDIGGRACHRCSENAVNISRECKTCSPCYGLIQTEVHRLREIKSDLLTLLHNTSMTFRKNDKTSFKHRIDRLDIAVGSLFNRAGRASIEEIRVVKDLLSTNKTMMEIEKILTVNISDGSNDLKEKYLSVNSTLNTSTSTIDEIYGYLWASIYMLENELQAVNNSMNEKLYVLESIGKNMSYFHDDYFRGFNPVSDQFASLDNITNDLRNKTYFLGNETNIGVKNELNISNTTLNNLKTRLNRTEIIFTQLYTDALVLSNLSNILLHNLNNTLNYTESTFNGSAHVRNFKSQFARLKVDIDNMNESLHNISSQARLSISLANKLLNTSKDNLALLYAKVTINDQLTLNLSNSSSIVRNSIQEILEINRTLTSISNVLQSFVKTAINTSNQNEKDLNSIFEMGFTSNESIDNLTKRSEFVNESIVNAKESAVNSSSVNNLTNANFQLADELIKNLSRLSNLSSALLQITSNQSSLMRNISDFMSNVIHKSGVCKNLTQAMNNEITRIHNLQTNATIVSTQEEIINTKLKQFLRLNNESSFLSPDTLNTLKKKLNTSQQLVESLNLSNVLIELRKSRDNQIYKLSNQKTQIEDIKSEIGNLNTIFDTLKKRDKCN